MGIDAVNIGGAEVREQALELATTVSGSFIADLNSDGLIGLGFSVSNQGKIPFDIPSRHPVCPCHLKTAIENSQT